MKIELNVPECATLTYELDAHVEQIVCRVGAHASLILKHSPDQAIMPMQQIYILEQHSSLKMHGWYENAIEVRLEVVLQGSHAQADIKIGIKGRDSAVAHFTTLQRHKAPHTISSLTCKSILADTAQTVHNGMIYIAHEATDTHAKLYSNHILKGSASHAYVQPNLEVLTDEVQCAHGSAIGMFDADMLFYMQSRGLDTMSAIRLLEEAFLAEVR